MTTRLRIEHVSRYSYGQPVGASYNEARLSPLLTPWQHPLESTLHVDQATWLYEYRDYWGTRVRVFEAVHPHSELVVHATSVVELDASLLPVADESLTWATLRSRELSDRFGEFLTQTAATTPDDDLAGYASSVAATAGPVATAEAIYAYVNEHMRYVPGATGVHTEGSTAWRARAGVCQDYAHVVIGALRHVGLPARYVSGYLHPSRDAEIGKAHVGESHAWVECWLGEWIGHDPTNQTEPGERHVLVGRGREYADVPPIKGIVAGVRSPTDLEVKVELTRLV